MTGWIYLLHFDRPISAAHTTQHYLGYTTDLDQRLRAHRNGKGSRLCQVARQRGIHFRVAEVWVGDRDLERALKRLKNAPKRCPYCQNTMKLIDYPEAIADLQRRILNHEQQMRLVQDSLDKLNGEIETTIAFDKTLTNDAQRKAQRLKFQEDETYHMALLEARAVQDEKTRLQIELDLLRGQFAVLKLEMRSVIVQQEAAIAA
jgi:predicted GIY-YIG superfamily endonuclease